MSHLETILLSQYFAKMGIGKESLALALWAVSCCAAAAAEPTVCSPRPPCMITELPFSSVTHHAAALLASVSLLLSSSSFYLFLFFILFSTLFSSFTFFFFLFSFHQQTFQTSLIQP
jgi:hypothetical protein